VSKYAFMSMHIHTNTDIYLCASVEVDALMRALALCGGQRTLAEWLIEPHTSPTTQQALGDIVGMLNAMAGANPSCPSVSLRTCTQTDSDRQGHDRQGHTHRHRHTHLRTHRHTQTRAHTQPPRTHWRWPFLPHPLCMCLYACAFLCRFLSLSLHVCDECGATAVPAPAQPTSVAAKPRMRLAAALRVRPYHPSLPHPRPHTRTTTTHTHTYAHTHIERERCTRLSSLHAHVSLCVCLCVCGYAPMDAYMRVSVSLSLCALVGADAAAVANG
jgi:hypothetical protein